MKYKITFLLLIKNRPLFFNRWYSFHSEKLKNCKLYIADGGNQSIFNNDKTKILKRKNIIYKKYQFDKDYLTFFKKVKSSLNQIKTKYVIFCSDDDFLNVEKIITTSKILERKSFFFKAASGKFVSFTGIDKYDRINSNITGLSFLNKNKNFYSKNNFFRLINFYKYPEGAFHYIVETNVLKKMYSLALKLKLKSADMLDLHVNTMLYSSINILRVKHIFHLHQFHEKSEAHNRSYSRLKNQKNWHHEKELYINSVCKFIGKKNFKKKINELFMEMFKENSKSSKINKNFFIFTKIKNYLLNRHTNFIYIFFKKFFVIKNISIFCMENVINNTDRNFLFKVNKFISNRKNEKY